jgi:hypothetical protein
MAMPPPNIDFTRLARKPSERVAIVEYVAGTPELQETDYVEWKSAYDLSDRVGAAKVARGLIGLANRERRRASRVAEGHAYLLIGVEAGRLHGVPVWDATQIEQWIAPLVNDSLRYEIHYVSVTGKDVLMLIVAPPQQGDPIMCLQRTVDVGGRTWTEGTVWIRRGSQTITPPNANEWAMLSARASAAVADETTLQLRVGVDTSKLIPLPADAFSDEVRNLSIRNMRGRREARRRPTSLDLKRARTDWRDEQFEEFLQQVSEHWVEYVVQQHFDQHEPQLVFTVSNDTDDNFSDVILTVDLPLRRQQVHLDDRDARYRLDAPEPPGQQSSWGSPVLYSMPRIASPYDPFIQESDTGVTVVFHSLDVRPQSTYERRELWVAIPETADLEIPWHATAGNTRGKLSGVLHVPIARDDQQSP